MFGRYFLGAIVALVFTLDAVAESRGAVNVAGEQRMLGQRIVKSYSQIGLGVVAERSKFQMDEAVQRFDDNLKQLLAESKSASARQALATLEDAWTPMRRTALGEVSLDQARKLEHQGEAVLLAAERLTLELQEDTAMPIGRWVNMAGRQRMLSQRLVKAYMLRQWGVDSASLRQQLESATNEFSGALSTLRQRPGNSAAVQAELDSLTVQWEWMKTSLASDGATSYRLILAEGSDSVLDLANQVVSLFEKTEQ